MSSWNKKQEGRSKEDNQTKTNGFIDKKTDRYTQTQREIQMQARICRQQTRSLMQTQNSNAGQDLQTIDKKIHVDTQTQA